MRNHAACTVSSVMTGEPDTKILDLAETLVTAPQLQWDDDHARWQPRGHVVCCSIEAGSALDEPLIVVDDEELTLSQLGAMLAAHDARVIVLFLRD